MSPDAAHVRLLLERQRYDEAFQELLPLVSDRQSTRLNVLSGWRNYLRFLQETGESLLNFGGVEVSYPQWLQALGAAPSTLNSRLIQARRLYSLLLELELVARNPFEATSGVHNPVEERRQVYTAAEVGQLLQHAGAEERLLVLLATELGLAGSELRRLKFSDILEGGSCLRIWRVRYRREGYQPLQEVPCSAALQDALSQWLRARGAAPLFERLPTGPVFQGTTGGLTDAELLSKLHLLCQRAGVTYKPWRALKHLAGVQKLAAGIETEEIRQVLGVQRLDPLAKKAGLEDGRKLRWQRQKGRGGSVS